ncbi:M20/M25/M40 family metallo-hydrolase [Leifsonia xyli]|uniref:M20/M25/M40 family metallo-hydrolase n=1 Tax=Leifsonia xyli TaxID=1575 RepID=UPI003D674E71
MSGADDEALERFRTLLRIPTMSRNAVEETDWEAFDRFVDALPGLYPALHDTLERERHGHSLLYRWRGRGSGAPTVLMAHFDVVPATDEGWTHPPFAATLTGDGEQRLLWGRGAIDDKGAVVAILEAVEALVRSGFQPADDVYLSFGHDEETVGSGARGSPRCWPSAGSVPRSCSTRAVRSSRASSRASRSRSPWSASARRASPACGSRSSSRAVTHPLPRR